MIAVPGYLRPFAYNVGTDRENVSFDLRCPCGCEKFRLMKNHLTVEELKELEEYMRSRPRTGLRTIHGEPGEDGKMHYYVRRFFFFKQPVELPEAPAFADVKVVKAVCASCGKEIVLFDNRVNGYDSQGGFIGAPDYVPHFRDSRADAAGVHVRLEQFEEEDIDPNHFSWIRIYRRKDKRLSMFFEDETS